MRVKLPAEMGLAQAAHSSKPPCASRKVMMACAMDCLASSAEMSASKSPACLLTCPLDMLPWFTPGSSMTGLKAAAYLQHRRTAATVRQSD